MTNEKRLIDANAFRNWLSKQKRIGKNLVIMMLDDSPTVDAVEVPDKQLLRAVKLLLKQYEHSKQSDYVHNPVVHAFYYTWKAVDEGVSDNDF